MQWEKNMSRTYRGKGSKHIWLSFFSLKPYWQTDRVTGLSFMAGEEPLTGKARSTAWSRWLSVITRFDVPLVTYRDGPQRALAQWKRRQVTMTGGVFA
jgi:hypothetical protein